MILGAKKEAVSIWVSGIFGKWQSQAGCNIFLIAYQGSRSFQLESGGVAEYMSLELIGNNINNNKAEYL